MPKCCHVWYLSPWLWYCWQRRPRRSGAGHQCHYLLCLGSQSIASIQGGDQEGSQSCPCIMVGNSTRLLLVERRDLWRNHRPRSEPRSPHILPQRPHLLITSLSLLPPAPPALREFVHRTSPSLPRKPLQPHNAVPRLLGSILGIHPGILRPPREPPDARCLQLNNSWFSTFGSITHCFLNKSSTIIQSHHISNMIDINHHCNNKNVSKKPSK